ncbi:MAG TPA: hypothetical protein VGF36_15740 [Rhodopila sp.]
MLPLLIASALAEEPPKADAPVSHHVRQTWQQHFAQANLAHDGHLTLEEAKGGYATIAKHFDDIDADHKGYVTENDIRAWRVMRRAARRLAKPPQDTLSPQHAFQRRVPEQHRVSTQQQVELPASAQTITTAIPGKF